MNISFTEGDPQLRGITALSDSPGVPTQITQECIFFFFYRATAFDTSTEAPNKCHTVIVF